MSAVDAGETMDNLLAALERAEAERDQAVRERDEARQAAINHAYKRRVAEQRADRLAAALDFYAAKDNWAEKWEPKLYGAYGQPGISDISHTASLAQQDGGKRARDALAASQETPE